MSLAGNVDALAGRIAEEFNTVRAEKADAQHSHAISDVSNLQTALDGKASTSHTHDDRYYTEAEVDTALSGKADAEHGHEIEDVNGLSTTLSGKADVSHQHAASDVTSGTLNIARIPTGTSSTTVALGNHTHSGVYAPVAHTHTANDMVPRQGTSASSINADSVDIVDLTLSGNVTLAVPTNGFNGKTIQVSATASGADRTLTFDGNYKRLNGIDASYVIPQNQILRAAIRRTGSTWIVEAVGVTQ